MVCVFARQTTEPLASLVKQIDAAIAKNSKLKSFVVVLTDDADATQKTLEAMAKDCSVKSIPLTLVESPTGPPDYQIHKDAEITVLGWNQSKVAFNHGYAKSKMTEKDVETILGEISKMLQ